MVKYEQRFVKEGKVMKQVKILHCADLHFDTPFKELTKEISQNSKEELLQVFKNIIDLTINEKVQVLLIAGDVFDNLTVNKNTLFFISNQLKRIENVRVFISPGNHDPYTKNSYYNQFNWNENVKIFTSKIEKIECEDANIYGYGFDDFYCKNSGVENIKIEDENKLNILVIHGTLDGGAIENSEYNPLSKKILKEKGFDYVALGHIHKLDYNQEENQNVVYPGSTVSLGFDELGKHGMIVGELEKEKIDLQFVPLDETEFKLYELDVTEIISKEELIEKINKLEFEKNNLIEIVLVGKRNFEIDRYELYKLISNDKIIKIKNKTKINYDLEKIANETTLKGLFAKEMLQKLNNENISNEEKEMIEKAVEIGMEALGI